MNKPTDPSLEDLKPENPSQSVGDAHRPANLEVDEGGPGTGAALGQDQVVRDELDHDGLDIELPADEQLPPDVPLPVPPVKEHPSRWSGPTP